LAVSCASRIAAPETEAVPAAVVPPIPVPQAMEPVRFEDREGGLWLSYADYRALERNIIAMREYIAKLETENGFWRGR